MTIALYHQTLPDWATRRNFGRALVRTGDVIATVLRPVVVAVAILIAAMWWSMPRASADPVTTVLNDVGVGNNGPISSMIAQVGEMFCPLIAQAGTNFASGSYKSNGNPIGGAIAGGVTNAVIQNQCPSWINDIANGHLPGVLTGASSALNPLQSVTGATTNPLQALTGAASAIPSTQSTPVADVTAVIPTSGMPVTGSTR
ncbi:hypothetical protein HZU40_03355 [Mycolicibacterium fluoranthenivorans]|uniref:DUF732 domain-containing protein n=1 Tax=Mycolicibacterium fluoranthenivorans TaxID=258505 RepID=A0A7G8PGD7_9MYCO|nr:hypothetical protein [Mycolicibacterium fluoranthenivorans]QNJ93403.1 hypothetical protein HZU40_03355 [Mycolicibacterium fluoranthenivorans]